MKKILIATDFSDAARNATEYGIHLSRAFHAKVFLCNVYQPVPVPVTDYPIYDFPDNMEKVSREQLQQELTDLHAVPALPIETHFAEGSPAQGLLESAETLKADLIIMGMKASYQVLRTVFGSTVTAVARQTKIPLLVIPEEIKYADPKVLALANDSNSIAETDWRRIETLQSIAQQFQSKIFVVTVSGPAKEIKPEAHGPIRDQKHHVPAYDIEYKNIKSENLQHALNDFIKYYHIDILAMLPDKHSLLETWFAGGATRSMIFQTHIPLLVLPQESIKKSGES